jgi:uncharacterized membrane protein
MMRRIGIYFLNGLLVILPLAGTVYLLSYAYQLINGWGVAWLFRAIPQQWHFPGMGLLAIVLLVMVVGFIAQFWITKKFLALLEWIIGKIPLVKGLYGTLKDTILSFLGDQKSFDTVVLVPLGGSMRLGFLTVKEARFTTEDGQEYLGVYFPQSLQFAGDLHWYKKEDVQVLDMHVDEALQLIVSAGVAGKKNSTLQDGQDGT